MDYRKASTFFVLLAFYISCKVNGKQNVEESDILRRLNELELEVKSSNENYKHLQEKMAVYEQKNAELSDELYRQRAVSSKKDDVINLLVTQLCKLDVLETTLVEQLHPESDVGAKASAKFSAVRPSRFVLHQGEAVAFHAVVDANGEVRHLGVNQTVIFDTVLLNINNGYHSQHGYFIAPTAGLYIFSTSVLDAGSKPLIHADLVKNGNVLARAYGHGNGGFPEQGSVTVVTQLNANDEVWVRLSCCRDSPVTGMRYTSFTGALLMLT